VVSSDATAEATRSFDDARAGQAEEGDVQAGEAGKVEAGETEQADADTPESAAGDSGADADACPSGYAPGAWGVPDRCDPTVPCVTINGSLCYVDGTYTGSAITRCRPGTVVAGWVEVGKDMWCEP
jgi:hypothetical protein